MKWQSGLACFILLCSMSFLAYEADQSSFHEICLGFSFAFSAYYLLCFSAIDIALRQGVTLAVIVRIALIPALPGLSDDIYRFLWDGQLTLHGWSPYAFRPSEIFHAGLPNFLSVPLFESLNSPDYFSVYPPISQGVFALTAFLSSGEVIWFSFILKIMFLMVECGTIYFLIKILSILKIPPRQALFYALNPLVIIEGIGNLHFEILMIFFIIIGIYFGTRHRWFTMVSGIALSIAVKMTSAILWPFLIPWLGFRRWSTISLGLASFLLLLFYPLWNTQLLSHFAESLDLYFRSFEFNASIYYLARQIGTVISGYNLISWIGPSLGITALAAMLLLIWINRSRDLKTNLTISILAFTIHLLLSTTIHPWYILLPLALSCLGHLRFVFIWSSLIWLSYWAYQYEPAWESPWLLILEYLGLALGLYLDKSEIVQCLHLKKA